MNRGAIVTTGVFLTLLSAAALAAQASTAAPNAVPMPVASPLRAVSYPTSPPNPVPVPLPSPLRETSLVAAASDDPARANDGAQTGESKPVKIYWFLSGR